MEWGGYQPRCYIVEAWAKRVFCLTSRKWAKPKPRMHPLFTASTPGRAWELSWEKEMKREGTILKPKFLAIGLSVQKNNKPTNLLTEHQYFAFESKPSPVYTHNPSRVQRIETLSVPTQHNMEKNRIMEVTFSFHSKISLPFSLFYYSYIYTFPLSNISLPQTWQQNLCNTES